LGKENKRIYWVLMKMSGKTHDQRPDDERAKVEHKCLECEHVPCVGFYRKGTKPFIGGELYVLQSLIEEKRCFPCEVGSLIYSLCQLSLPLIGMPSTTMFAQCIRDLKASAYLLLSCHYRSSIQLLRPIVENYVAGLYWDTKSILASQDEKVNDFQQSYSDFLADIYEIPTCEWYEVFPKDKGRPKKKLDADFCSSWLVKKGVIENKLKNEITELVGRLNKYLHPHGLKFTEMERPDCPGCPSFVRYQEDEHQECIGFFQDVACLLMNVFYTYISVYFPDKIGSEEISNAIGFPKVLENLEKEFNTQLIFSQKLRTFLSQFEPS